MNCVRHYKEAFDKMEVGDAFTVPASAYSKAKDTARYYSRKNLASITVSKRGDTVTIARTA